MYLKTLRPYHFRNLEDAAPNFSRGVNVIVGKNGQGKTNLVEAIHLLGLSRSFRTSNYSELIRWGEKDASVFGVIVNNAGEIELGVALEEKGRGYYLNGQKLKTVTEFVGHLVCVGFSPQDLMLLQGPPSGRRKFLDRHLSDLTPAHLGSLLSYNRALQSKNRILKEGIQDVALLDAWNAILAREALVLVQSREEFIRALQAKARHIYAAFCQDDEELSLDLSTNVKESLRTPAALCEEFQRYRGREVAFGSSLLGPHRDDLLVRLGSRDARAFASQGQCRSIVLALTLGVIELLEDRRGESPVVLLDDVNSELDTARSDAFFKLVLRQGRQIFITGTDASVSHLRHGAGYHVLSVERGFLHQQAN
jgi:DNA replication and repair protein RecF